MKKPPLATSVGEPTDADKSWLAFIEKEKQEAPKRLEDTAKFLAGIISISLTVFITKRPEGLAEWTGKWFVWAAVFWVLSAVASFFVLYPLRYDFAPDSPDDIRRAYRKITVHKQILLFVSLLLFLWALGFASYAFVCGGF